jgi:DNA-binding CsgD family transcriptional regulator
LGEDQLEEIQTGARRVVGTRNLDLNDCAAVPDRPLAIFRHLTGLLRRLDGISLSYHVAPPFTSMAGNLPTAIFASKRAYSFRNTSAGARRVVGAVHDMVLSRGMATAYLEIAKLVENIDPQLLARIQQQLAEIGIVDELMIPCYGHHGIDGCLCYSFPYPVADLDKKTIQFLEGSSQIAHQKLISAYYSRSAQRETALSARESEIISWIAKSKSSTDIATIMNISAATVETYIKRIFKKLDVNNRMSAVIAVLASGRLRN